MSKTEQRESVSIWRKSSYSIGNGQCVEAAAAFGTVMVRDTGSPAGGQLRFPAGAWHEFVGRIQAA